MDSGLFAQCPRFRHWSFAQYRYVEAVTPVLAALHPSSIVDSLHFQSCSAVKAQNKLSETGASGAGSGPDAPPIPSSSAGETDGESKTSRLQVMISLSKVCMLIITF